MYVARSLLLAASAVTFIALPGLVSANNKDLDTNTGLGSPQTEEIMENYQAPMSAHRFAKHGAKFLPLLEDDSPYTIGAEVQKIPGDNILKTPSPIDQASTSKAGRGNRGLPGSYSDANKPWLKYITPMEEEPTPATSPGSVVKTYSPVDQESISNASRGNRGLPGSYSDANKPWLKYLTPMEE